MKKLTLTLILFSFFICLHAQSYSLEDVLSAHYTSDLVVSPDRSHVAWVSNERGTRQLFYAALPDLVPKAVFKSGQDDGQVISNIQFDHKNNHLYAVIGSGPNRNGEIANPASLVKYPSRNLIKIDLNDKKTDTIGNYGNYIISANNNELLLPSGKSLYSYSLEKKNISQVLSMRGTVQDVSYHPDGKQIIFTSNRGDHSFIGHYTFGNDRINWLSPSIDRDISPQWSPDGNQVAWIRIPGLKKGELYNLTGGNPFSIVVHDIRTGQAEAIWQSPSDDGGFAQYYPAEPLRWTSSDHIVFYSEHEGWMKLYSYDFLSERVVPLMSSNCEIEHSSTNKDGSQIVFSHNCDETNKRDIAIFDLKSETIINSMTSPYIETDPVFMEDGTLIYRMSAYNQVTNISRIGPDINETIFPVEMNAEFPGDRLVEPEGVIFIADDGTEIHGQLFNVGNDRNKPGLIFMHGGPIRQMLLGVHYSSYYANAYLMNQFLASRGYVVLSVNFRAGIGYGRDFRRAENQGPRGASEYQDIVAGARFLQGLDIVDPDKIGLWGGSYGGLLTAQGLARNSDIFKAGVDFHGVHDWSWRATDFSPGGAWGITEDLMELAFNSSPVADVDGWKSPVLFIHGDDDRNVMFGQTTDLVRRLRDKNVTHEILVLPDEVHGFYRWQSWYDAYAATADFFDRYLKK
jgi:dipeptidyl aminopeptidase/acylaminoacyl peptidase